MKALSLFSGIGGIDLACEWAGIETVAFCERELFPRKVLRKHWPNVPIYDDVCTLTKERLDADGIGPIELIHGGYPCQPFSFAGKRQGKEDDRHLWPEVFRLIESVRPRWFVGENVAGHVSLGLDDVLADLEKSNYTAKTFILPAAAIGASHRRDRVFIVAHTSLELPHRGWRERGGRDEYPNSCKNVAHTESERFGEARESSERSEEWSSSSSAMGDPNSILVERQQHARFQEMGRRDSTREYKGPSYGTKQQRATQSGLGGMLDGLSSRLDSFRWPAGRGQAQHEWEPPRVKVGGTNRTGRLKSLGNAVVPQQIYPILAAIMQIEAITEK